MFGGVLNLSLARHGGNGAADFEAIRQLLDQPGRVARDGAVRAALGQSLHLTFWAVFATTVLTLLLATLVPAVKVKQNASEPVVE